MQTNWSTTKSSLTYCVILLLFSLPILFLSRESKEPEAQIVVAPEPLPEVIPDFASIQDVKLKKQTFFNFVENYVDEVNEGILRQRARILAVRDKLRNAEELSNSDLRYLSTLAEQYELDADDYTNLEFINIMLRRVDVIPSSLALAQAANESAWGTSRFAQDGNNYFGHWCYTDGCGIVPMRRREGANHEVRRYDSVKESVQAYIHNLNTFPSYQLLRRIRQQLRTMNRPIDGISLADGLESYSSRGLDYIDDVQTMIYSNKLLGRDKPAL